MWVKSLSAPTCPGTHGLTSPQSFPTMFTKFLKSPKLPETSDNAVVQTCFPPVGHSDCCFLVFYFLRPLQFLFLCSALKSCVMISHRLDAPKQVPMSLCTLDDCTVFVTKNPHFSSPCCHLCPWCHSSVLVRSHCSLHSSVLFLADVSWPIDKVSLLWSNPSASLVVTHIVDVIPSVLKCICLSIFRYT